MIINPEPTIENVGGKGFQLLQLQNVCPVPRFFILQFNTNEEIDDVGVQSEIMNYFISNGYEEVAVRSSATQEDSSKASFAGMFDTLLCVKKDRLIEAIREVLQSVHSERVKEYALLKNLRAESIRMCVVVQEMVKSRVAGVCFSRESENGDTLLLEACYGLGEALVSGLITPDTYRINRETLSTVFQQIGFQRVEYDNTGALCRVPFHKRNAKKLTNIEIHAIAEAALTIEEKLNYHAADIEWAIQDNTILFLQVRPFLGLSGGK